MMTSHFISRWHKKITALFMLAVISVSFIASASEWPQELKGDKGTIVIYQPQPEKLVGNVLTGRAAMQLILKNKKDPVFGVFWFSSSIQTDRDTNSVVITNIKVTKVGWPDSKDSEEQTFTNFVEHELQHSSFSGSLSKLTATLATADQVEESLEGIKNDPPIIIFKDKLAVLLTYDGKPLFKDIDNSPYQRALNTPFAVVKVKNKAQYYLTSGSLWYQANSELGPWQPTSNVPSDLLAMIAKSNSETENTENKPSKTPDVVTATKPTELVVSDGKPNWVSLTGGKLLYVKNTETPWVREIANGDMYILLSGRWFTSKTEQGPWSFVRADKLPVSFKDIPPESDIGGLRSSVAGTDEAEQAVLDSQIPQTAAIQRSEATLTVEYDGEPKFEDIVGTDVAYAVNTSAQVLKIKGKFYAVDSGVWFVANDSKGPWVVADSIPNTEIAQIPPSSPVYNTTYVKVYDSTPEIVYVGYTPGYMGSYPYYGVPIYGTGWYYPPYYGAWYYPRPPTWGLHVGYNPWTGWNVGVSWGGPFFRVGVSWSGGYNHHHGYYGGYHGGYHGGHHTNININGDINIGNSTSIGNKNHIINNIGKTNIGKNNGRNISNNLYNKPSNIKRNATNIKPNRSIKKAQVSSQHTNNVFSDRTGNVVRHQDGQWQSRTDNTWKTQTNQRLNNNATTKNNIQNRVQSSNIQRGNLQSGRNRNINYQHMNRDRQARSMGGGFGGGRRGGGRR
ncbi:carbohydrate-binding family V/XII [Colwellia sp. E2M01]|uniref:carbohydrate-binding family V/XII n=1 Tax=Colwellia sp. E2M01 TaxID=2841561 RepID=UPI001C08EF34|nr:carbohydrate-binding family V/XII [Colwellia sp. E2M01]MBU2871376.1 carbohydrate-binding family V/XII [Colwellia sp. E2M01]